MRLQRALSGTAPAHAGAATSPTQRNAPLLVTHPCAGIESQRSRPAKGAAPRESIRLASLRVAPGKALRIVLWGGGRDALGPRRGARGHERCACFCRSREQQKLSELLVPSKGSALCRAL